jgi:hypothetical protein
VANRPLSPPILIALLTIAAFALCRGSTGSAQPSHLTSGGVLPYVRDGFEHGVGPPWDQTPNDDSRLFRLVQGYRSRKALALTVTPTSYGPNLSGQMTAVSLQHEIAHAGWSAEPTGGTWYRAYVRFPRRRYKPTPGEWNWLIVWHNDSRTSSFPHATSIAMGVLTDNKRTSQVVAPGRRPRLFLRLLGGDVTAPQSYTVKLRPNSLRYNHWYDILFHFVWSPDPEIGLAEWWVDGRQKVSVAFPTLYTLPDGSRSHNGFGLYNYRLHAPWTSEVAFDDVALGPDLASVRR